MNYINIYMQVLKNRLNYELIYLNKKKKIWWFCVINYIFIIKKYSEFKWNKVLCKQNGFKLLILKNWYRYNIKHNLLEKIFSK